MTPTNKRKSTNYTWPTFFPIAFGLQFLKVVNIFYLCTAILQSIPAVSTNKPIVIIVPLSCVIGLGIIQELIGECKRYKSDKATNALPATRYRVRTEAGADGDQFIDTTLENVKVGDILKLKDSDEIPADCILIKTEDKDGKAFVKTSQLDGERNLKPKLGINAVNGTAFDEIFGKSDKGYQVEVNCIEPHKDLYSYNGNLIIK
jgi:magnesium-transporting ATPase (P-type)